MTYGLEPPDERRLGESLRSGLSPQAVLEDIRRRLVRYAVKLVWNRADAEEIVQEAFKIAVSKAMSVEDESFAAWMFRTTGNLCLNFRRRRTPEALADWVGESRGRTPLESAADAERLERLRATIAELPQQQRIAVTLRHIEQFAYRDVAEIMAISESAARAHVHQGRRRLADTLRELSDE